MSNHGKKGFTTLELLIVLLILGITMNMGLSAYSDFNHRQIVTQAAKKVKNYLRLAQSKALVGEKDCRPEACGGVWNDSCGCYQCGPASQLLDGWLVNFSTRKIYGRCGSNSFAEVTFEIPSDIVLTSTPNIIQFSPLNQGVTEATICISKFNLTYKMRTIRAGEIKEDGLVSSCP